MRLGPRLAALAAGFALLALAGSAGGQLEARPAALGLQGGAALQRAERAGIDIAGVIETVGHRVEPAKGNRSLLVSEDRLYRAEFGASGFSLTLRRQISRRKLAARTTGRPPLPAQTIPFQRAPAFRIEKLRAQRGDTPIAVAHGRWRSARNSALRTLAPGLSERVTSLKGKLEWDFALARAPVGRGALTIEARVFGATSATPLSGSGPAWRFAVAAGRNVALGRFVVKDARSRSLYRARPILAGRRLSLTVPERVLRGAAYPLTIDPVVSPEYPVSDPVHSGAPRHQLAPAIAFDGTNYLVAWYDYVQGGVTAADIYGTRVSPAGAVLDPSGIAISTAPNEQSSPAVAFDGTNYLVAWQDGRAGTTNYDIYGARVSPAGSVLDRGGIAISTAAGNQYIPAIAFDGTNDLVVWTDARSSRDHIYGARVSPAGTVLDPGGIAISITTNDELAATVAFDGTNYLVVWQTFLSTRYDIYGARVSPAGTVLDPGGIAISTAAAEQEWPSLAFDGTNYLVVWQDNRPGTHRDIYGTRVSPGGVVLDPDGIAISVAASSQYEDRPTVAFDGTNYLVVWDRYNGSIVDLDLYCARVSPAGTVLDPAGIVLSIAGEIRGAPRLSHSTARITSSPGMTSARARTVTSTEHGSVLPAACSIQAGSC